MNTQDPKYQQKSKAISSAEPNYLSQFEMRYPVDETKTESWNLCQKILRQCDRNKVDDQGFFVGAIAAPNHDGARNSTCLPL